MQRQYQKHELKSSPIAENIRQDVERVHGHYLKLWTVQLYLGPSHYNTDQR